MTDVRDLFSSMSMKFNSDAKAERRKSAGDGASAKGGGGAGAGAGGGVLDLNRDKTAKWRALKNNNNAKKWPEKCLKKKVNNMESQLNGIASSDDDKCGVQMAIENNLLLKQEKDNDESSQGRQVEAEHNDSGGGVSSNDNSQLPKEKIEVDEVAEVVQVAEIAEVVDVADGTDDASTSDKPPTRQRDSSEGSCRRLRRQRPPETEESSPDIKVSNVNVENSDERPVAKRRGRSRKVIVPSNDEKPVDMGDGTGSVEKRTPKKRKQTIDNDILAVDSLKIEEDADESIAGDDAFEKGKKTTRRSVRLEHRNEIKTDIHLSDDEVKPDIPAPPKSPPLTELSTTSNIIVASPSVQLKKLEDEKIEKTPPKKRGRRAKVKPIEKQASENSSTNQNDTPPSSSGPLSKKNVSPKDNSEIVAVVIPKRSQRRIKPTPKILENDELRYEYETKNIERITSFIGSENDFTPLGKPSTSRSSSKHREVKSENSSEGQPHQTTSAVKKKLHTKFDRNLEASKARFEKKPCPDIQIFLSEVRIAKWHHTKLMEDKDKKLSKKQQHKVLKQKHKHMERIGLQPVKSSDASDFENSSDDNEEFVPSKRVKVEKTNVTLRIRGPKETTPPTIKNASSHKPPSVVAKKQRQKVQPAPQINDKVAERENLERMSKLSSPTVLVQNPFHKDVSKEFICLCHKPSPYYTQKTPETAFCCAIDHIEEQKVGCCNQLEGSLLNLLRPSSRVGYMILCDDHKKRFRAHNCCAGCGIFCTQGKFSFCKQQHFFHPDCAQKFILNSPYDPATPGNYTSPTLVLKCPHCGIDTPERTSTVTMKCQSLPVFLPSQKAKIKPAKMGLPVVQISVTGSKNKNRNSNNNVIARKMVSLDTLIPESVMNVAERAHIRRSNSDLTPHFTAKDMYYAVTNDDLERVAEILNSGYDITSRMRDFHDGTCLHLVANCGTLQMAYLLLCKEFPQDFVNMIDRQMRTASMWAVISDKCDILHLFTQCGSDLAVRGPEGKTCLHFAAERGNLEAMQILVKSYKSCKSVNSFFKLINAQDDGGWTPMVWAAEAGHTEIVSFLLNHGAEPNICDNDNNTVLHWATLYSGSLETINLLLQAGGDCNVQNVLGDTPLHIACRNSSTRLCIALISNGADLMIKNKAGELPYDRIPNEDSPCARTVGFNIQMRSFGPTGLKNRVVCGDISNGREQRPIQVVRNELNMSIAAASATDSSPSSDESDELLLPDFKYITKTIIQQNPVQIDQRVSQMRICSCSDGCITDQCQCTTASVQNWYTAEGRLSAEFNYEDPPVIFECNDVCGCNKLVCKNRIVQNGIKIPLQVTECEEQAKGWGVRSLVNIPKGSFVAEYTGEILTDFEADRRMDDSYFFDIGHEHCIDANYYGNVSRFFNHSCEPNLVPVRVFFEHQDFRFPKIALFACKNIIVGQELCFDYGDKFWTIKRRYFTCKCKSSLCKYLNEKTGSSSPKQQDSSSPQHLNHSQSDQIQHTLSLSNGSDY